MMNPSNINRLIFIKKNKINTQEMDNPLKIMRIKGEKD